MKGASFVFVFVVVVVVVVVVVLIVLTVVVCMHNSPSMIISLNSLCFTAP